MAGGVPPIPRTTTLDTTTFPSFRFRCACVCTVCNERGAHEIWGKISVWGLSFFYILHILWYKTKSSASLFFFYSFSCSIFRSAYRSKIEWKIEIWREISKPVDSLSLIQFPSSLSLPFSIRGTPFPENVRKGLGLGDSVRIDRKGSLLDFSNFRKRIMFVNRSIGSLLTVPCVYIYIVYFSVILQITKREVEIPEILLDRSSP